MLGDMVNSAQAEGVWKQVKLGCICDRVDGDYVEADGDGGARPLGEGAEVGAGEAAQHAALVFIDRGFGGGQVAGGAGLHLDEAEMLAVPGDEVDVSAEAGAGPALGDDDVTAAAEFEEGGALAEQAGGEVWCGIWSA